MNLPQLLRSLSRHWRLVALALLICVGAAAYASAEQPRRYRTGVMLLFSSPPSTDPNTTIANAYLYQQQMLTYAQLVGSNQVVGAALTKAGAVGGDTAVSVQAVPDTVLLRVTVTDSDPTRAKNVADAFGDVAQAAVDRVDGPRSGGRAPVNVSLLEPAPLPGLPYTPRPKVNLALGTLLGLMLGVAAVAIAEALDVSVKSGDELSRLAGDAPMLGGVPDEDRGDPLVALYQPRSVRAESYRQVRTNLQFASIDLDLKTVVVTSPMPGEGKTTLVTNLGIVIASGGSRVLIVDADLRRPMVANNLGLEGNIGLTTVLLGQAPLDVAIQRWGDGLIDVLASGPIPPNPSEILGSHRMQELVDVLASRYDLVIFDTPPALPVTDASLLALHTDGAVLVARVGRTSRDGVRRVSTAFRTVGVNVIGVVANRVSASGAGSGYAYAYEYGASKGSKSESAPLGPVRTLQPARRRGKAAKAQSQPVTAETPADGKGVGDPAWEFPTDQTTQAAIKALRDMSRSRWRRETTGEPDASESASGATGTAVAAPPYYAAPAGSGATPQRPVQPTGTDPGEPPWQPRT